LPIFQTLGNCKKEKKNIGIYVGREKGKAGLLALRGNCRTFQAENSILL